ncbi:MAG TPA: 4'-phosphopantetheinyl transferase superfamily protein [Chloroflexaceae bacterium]|nr:4'-phosphopantetheinyl transferase superfamily protein [Chloroflexaceae bacterium]
MGPGAEPQSWASPPTPLVLGPGELHVWRVVLAVEAVAARRLAEWLSPDERERAARFAFAGDRERFVVARGALRALLGAYLGLPPAALRFAYSRHGKPSLDGPAAPLAFNLAHAGELALVVVARGRRVGVDVERVRDDFAYAPLLPDIFSPRERRAIAELPEERRRRAFFEGWARKEAYLKARGDGLSVPPSQVEVAMAPGERAPLRLPPDDAGGPWALAPLDAGDGYAAAVVVEGEPALLRLFAAPPLPDAGGELPSP